MLQGYPIKTSPDATTVAASLLQSLGHLLGYTSYVLLLRDRETGAFRTHSLSPGQDTGPQVTLSYDSPFVRYLSSNPVPVRFAQLEKVPSVRLLPTVERQVLRSLGGDTVVPLATPNSLMGLAILESRRGLRGQRDVTHKLSLLGGVLARVIEAAEVVGQAQTGRGVAHRYRPEDAELRSETLGLVVHDLNNRISNILAQVEILEGQRNDMAKFEEAIAYIRGEAARAARATPHLRALLESAGGLPHGVVDLGQIVKDAVALLETRTRRSRGAEPAAIQLGLDSAGPVKVNGDSVQLLEALTRVISSSVDSLPAHGGSVKITIRELAGWVYLSIEDNGATVPKADLPHIFGPDFHMEGRKGLGAPLLAVRSIVEGNGGRIRAELAAEGGIAFVISLPATQDDGSRSSNLD